MFMTVTDCIKRRYVTTQADLATKLAVLAVYTRTTTGITTTITTTSTAAILKY